MPPSLQFDQPTFVIVPNRPSASSLMPAAKNRVLGSPPDPPLPKRKPHRPSIWIGALVSLFSWPSQHAGGREGADLPITEVADENVAVEVAEGRRGHGKTPRGVERAT